jgi:hypothetical protein
VLIVGQQIMCRAHGAVDVVSRDAIGDVDAVGHACMVGHSGAAQGTPTRSTPSA